MIYIGKHKTENPNDDYMGSSRRLKEDIVRYGIENFKKEILFDYDNYQDMNDKERELVNEDFVNRSDTYNLNLGGSGGWFECNKRGENNKSKQYLIASEKCKIDPTFRKKMCENISKGLREFIKEHPDFQKGKKNNMFGRRHSDESKAKMSEKRLGKLNSSYGTFWITNESIQKNMKWKDHSSIPSGWRLGRKFYSTRGE